MAAVVTQFINRVMDIIQRSVFHVFLHAWWQFWGPAYCELFDRTDVQMPLVEKRFKLRHLPGHKTSVLADAITRHWGLALCDM